VLHSAVEGGLEDVVDYLLKEFDLFSVHTQDAAGNQALHLAATRSDPGMLTNLIVRAESSQVRLALVNATNNLGQTPLFNACRRLDLARVKAL
jgi:ankyrin repeat protein